MFISEEYLGIQENVTEALLITTTKNGSSAIFQCIKNNFLSDTDKIYNLK